MRKKMFFRLLKSIKKVLLPTLIILISVNSFAAVIFGDEGRNFITKQEFEDLKENFESQIDDYNRSLEGKIEGAIFAYLSGLVTKRVELKSLLDEEGKYGGFLEKWCSRVDGAYDRKYDKYFRNFWSIYVAQGKYSTAVTYDEPWFTSYNSSLPPGQTEVLSTDWDYNTSKKVKIKLDTLDEVNNALSRMKITSKMYASVWEESPTYDSSNHSSSTYNYVTNSLNDAVENSIHGIQQNKDNVPCFAGLNNVYDLSSSVYWSGRYVTRVYDNIVHGVVSTSTKEVTYEYDKVNVNYPISSAYDLYWDSSSTLAVTHDGSSQEILQTSNISNSTTAGVYTKEAGPWPHGSSLSWASVTPRVYTRYKTPWCCIEGIAAKDAYLEHWNTVSSKNRQVKNGMYIGETSGAGDVIIKAEADYAGTLYVFIGDDKVKGTDDKLLIDNWTTDEYKGSKFHLNKDDEKECKIEEVNQEQNIWILFLPDAATETVGGVTKDVQAVLKIKEMYENSIH